ncbi:hypothetical protein VTO42DRAFT_5626 [Malbranchea cinnamomea]
MRTSWALRGRFRKRKKRKVFTESNPTFCWETPRLNTIQIRCTFLNSLVKVVWTGKKPMFWERLSDPATVRSLGNLQKAFIIL